jgi:hypothetical protein
MRMPNPNTGVLVGVLAAAAGAWLICGISGGRNPPLIASHRLEAHVEVPASIEAILVRSCKDCHSNETRWPWYSRLPVASDLIQEDVKRARAHMNFSDWNVVASRGRDEERAAFSGICEELRSGEMPMVRYRRFHSQARLTQSEVEAVCAWSDRTGAMVSEQWNSAAH